MIQIDNLRASLTESNHISSVYHLSNENKNNLNNNTNAVKLIKFIVYSSLFLIRIAVVMLYILSESFPSNNTLGITPFSQEVLSFIIAINTSIINQINDIKNNIFIFSIK
eukprot:183712_1